jgi:hypothetical protein
VRLFEPWPAGSRISSPFGVRRHPISGRQIKHTGVDVPGVFPVTVAAPGVVVHVGADWASQSAAGRRRQSAGNNVTIDHGEVHTSYFHGQKRSQLRVGQRVNTGDFIFTSGTTGASTGNHLHFEVRRNRNQSSAVDPIPYLNGNAAVPVLKVTGRPDRASWTAWQTWLQELGYYQGRVDGVPGPMTYRAIQGWVEVPQTGLLTDLTRRAVQRELGVTVDGVWGRETWSTLQRKLNEGTL